MTADFPPNSNRTVWVYIVLAIAVGVAGIVWISQREAAPKFVSEHFRGMAQVELLTVFPDYRELEQEVRDANGLGPAPEAKLGFIADHRIIDRRVLSSPGDVVDRVLSAMRPHEYDSCFAPRHALRDPNEPNNYILFCFECGQLIFEVDGQKGHLNLMVHDKLFFTDLVNRLEMESPTDSDRKTVTCVSRTTHISVRRPTGRA